MKTIYFGNKFISGLVSDTETNAGQYALVYTGLVKPSFCKYFAGGANGEFVFQILDAADEVLVQFDVPKYSNITYKSGFNFSFTPDGLLLTVGISDTTATAIKSGVAVKFKYLNLFKDVIASGTVGGVNSDCDLLIGDTNISIGSKYKNFGFKVLIPHKMYLV